MKIEKEIKKSSSRTVFEAYTRDVGRNVCRIDYDTMDKLDISTGDVVRLKYKKRTAPAKALPLYPSDEKKDLVRIDGLLRKNLDVKVGIKIEVTKAFAKMATKIVFHPQKPVPPLDGRYLSDTLESVALQKGSLTMIPYFGGRLTYKVVSTEPKGIVIVRLKTECIILDNELPPEVTEYENVIKKEKNKIIKESKTEIQKLLKHKKYKEANVFALDIKEQLDEIDQSYKALKEILRRVEEEYD